MAHLKDYIRATSPVIHFLTYADNHAIGHRALHKCPSFVILNTPPPDRVVESDLFSKTLLLKMLLKQKASVLAKIRTLSKSHVIHLPPQQWANASDGVVLKRDPWLASRANSSIPGDQPVSRMAGIESGSIGTILTNFDVF
jgi:histone acetyltransferase